MRKPLAGRHVRAVLTAAVVAALAACALQASGALNRVERDSVDVRFSIRGAQPAEGIVVVAIDEDTFTELDDAVWPFPRTRHARVVDRLREAGARLIVYDVQFTEPSPKPAADLALYDALGRAGGALLATGESDSRGRTNVLGGDENLARIGARAGASNLSTDPGGVVRRYPRRVGMLDTLPVLTAKRLGAPLRPGDFDDGEAWIDFRGGPGTFPTVSFSDVHDGRVDPSRLRGKVVVVGAGAATLQDMHGTATSGADLMSGPELQANAIWTALEGNSLRSLPDWTIWLTIVAMALAAPLLALRLRPLALLAAIPLLAAAHAVGTQLLFEAGYVHVAVAPLAALGLGTAAAVVAAYVGEARERRWVARYSERLEAEVRERTAELRETQLEVVERLAKAAESRDNDTGEHIERMSALCERLGLEVGMTPDEAEMLRYAAILHDIGKISVPDRVLLKPGKLSPEERDVMETHAMIGSRLLADSRSPLLRTAEEIARTHHERWDGRGYPAGLAGTEIPFAGRICAICDVFDALTTERPYKRAWSVPEALAEIERGSGTQFDPDLVDAFLRIAPEVLEVRSPLWSSTSAGEPSPPPGDPVATPAATPIKL
jgi:response regulator RpfG family c-di-GMP phosphodiesterase